MLTSTVCNRKVEQTAIDVELLDDPDVVIQGDRVPHLRYWVRR